METSTHFAADGTVTRIDQWDATTYRRFDGQGVKVEERPATAAEKAFVAAGEARANSDTIRAAAAAALNNNRTFQALGSPTNAQVVAQVKALTRQNNALIRLALGQLDGTD